MLTCQILIVLCGILFLLLNFIIRRKQESNIIKKWLKYREKKFRTITESLNQSVFKRNQLQFEIGELSSYIVLKVDEGHFSRISEENDFAKIIQDQNRRLTIRFDGGIFADKKQTSLNNEYIKDTTRSGLKMEDYNDKYIRQDSCSKLELNKKL